MALTSTAAVRTAEISVSVAVTVFPDEIYRAPKSWTQRAFRNLIYFNAVDQGGHFAAWEQPTLFAAELRVASRVLHWIPISDEKRSAHYAAAFAVPFRNASRPVLMVSAAVVGMR